MITRFHSPRTLSRPRSRNWRNPSADLMMPNTGSGVCLRRAYSARPSGVFSRCAIASTGVEWSGGGGDEAKRSASGGWCGWRPIAISGSISAATQACTLASLKHPLSASSVSIAPTFRQLVELLQHRHDLLLVVACLHHIIGDHQQTARRHRRLGVVALLEAAARHRHDAALFV